MLIDTTNRYRAYVYLDDVEYEVRLTTYVDEPDRIDVERIGDNAWNESLEDWLLHNTAQWKDHEQVYLVTRDGEITVDESVGVRRSDLVKLLAMAWRRDHKTKEENGFLMQLENKHDLGASVAKHSVTKEHTKRLVSG